MKSRFLKSEDVLPRLQKLMLKHDEFHWAVAWGTDTTAASKALMKNKKKLRDVTFGVSFSHTDPELLAKLEGVEGAKVATEFSGGTFHPKVYAFRSGKKAAAIVGSANFTNGGLCKNMEGSVYITGNASSKFFQDIFNFTSECASYGAPITPEYVAAYRISAKRAARMKTPPHNPLSGIVVAKAEGTGRLLNMDWSTYVEKISKSKHHDISGRLELLRICQKWLASVSSFSDLPLIKRQAIAGIIGKQENEDTDLNHNWGWFGSMGRSQVLKNRIEENDRYLARAIDSIPQKGEVTRKHYHQFVKYFLKAFKGSSRTGTYRSASRLLAIKRPDVFLCICGPNIMRASDLMGFAYSTLSLGNYWERVVEIVRLSEWYNTSKPDNLDPFEGELWESRLAMLDVIIYESPK